MKNINPRIFCFLFSLFFCQINDLEAQLVPCKAFSSANNNTQFPGCHLCAREVSERTPDQNRVVFFGEEPSCFTIENNLFFTLLSNSAGEIDLEIQIDSCEDGGEGLEGVLFDLNFKETPSCFSINKDENSKLVKFERLTPNEFYTLMIDGIDNAVCFFKINSKTIFPVDVFPTASPGTIRATVNNLESLCIGDKFCFLADSITDHNAYYWTLPYFLIPIHQSENQLCVEVFPNDFNFSRKVIVESFKGCKKSDITSEIEVRTNPNQTNSEIIFVCSGKFPIMFLDSVIHEFGQFLVEETISDNCTTKMHTIFVTPAPSKTEAIDTAMCIGHDFTIEGQTIQSPGFYQFITPSSDTLQCDSIIKLNLSISGDVAPEIQCVYDTFLNVLSINWDKIRLADGYYVLLNGDTISNQPHRGFIYTPNQIGEKVDLKIQPYNSRGCSFEPGFSTCFAETTNASEVEKSIEEIDVFPNPSSGIFQIKSEFLVEKIKVSDVFGQHIFQSEKGNTIDLSDFSEGVYFFKIETKKGMQVKRVLKN